MLKNNETYKKKVMNNTFSVYDQDRLPPNHVYFLETLSAAFNFKPKVFMILVLVFFIGKDIQRDYGLTVKLFSLMPLTR